VPVTVLLLNTVPVTILLLNTVPVEQSTDSHTNMHAIGRQLTSHI